MFDFDLKVLEEAYEINLLLNYATNTEKILEEAYFDNFVFNCWYENEIWDCWDEAYREKWLKEARKQTIETLPFFLQDVVNKYKHNYSSICHASIASAIAVINCVDNSDQGGITGFQTGWIMWGFIREWYFKHNKTGLKLIDFDEMLYPQYEDSFKKTINKETWNLIRKEAERNISKNKSAEVRIIEHWRRIADGNIPFGFTIKEDD